ncbi:hypothetical protein [Arthrobacter sp. Ld5]|uniref:hypothetical protein n=1 Tax=Arthrobacter sp. Ld5 TaxID=649152 RepID=UPI003EBB59C0
MWDQLESGAVRNPSLSHLLDKYLQTVWELALAAPLPYVEGSPSSLPIDADLFELPGNQPGAATEISHDQFKNVLPEEVVGQPSSLPFDVFFDDLQLQRPIVFNSLPATSHALTRPLVFAGHLIEGFEGRDEADTTGTLEFYAYIMWAPKIAPVEHNGVMIRVNGASGTLFDRSFLQFQIAELTRLRQLSCEVFVLRGFEGALNIDREAFNASHPHALRLTSWVHAAVARVINQQKSLANAVRREARSSASSVERDRLETIAREAWQKHRNVDEEFPEIVWSDSSRARTLESISLEREIILGNSADKNDRGAVRRRRQVVAMAQVLAAFNLMDDFEREEFHELLRYLADVLEADA